MIRVVLYGAGALARETAEVVRRLRACGEDVVVVAFVVDEPVAAHSTLLGLPILSDLDRFAGDESVRFCIAIGDPTIRVRVAARLGRWGARFATIVDPQVWVGSTSMIGEGSIVFGHSSITVDSSLGCHAVVNPGCTIAHDNRLGDFASLSPGVHLAGHVQCEENCFFGVGVSVRPKIRIGRGAYIGAGAVVVSDVAAGTIVVGNPARPFKSRT